MREELPGSGGSMPPVGRVGDTRALLEEQELRDSLRRSYDFEAESGGVWFRGFGPERVTREEFELEYRQPEPSDYQTYPSETCWSNASKPDTTQPYFLDLISQIDELTGS